MTEQLSLFGDNNPSDDSPSTEPAQEPAQPQTVSAITRTIQSLIEGDQNLQNAWLEGEVSNFKRAASGHLYFSIKDDNAQLKCVMWKSAAARLNFSPQHGDQIEARGKIGVYSPQGIYQFYVESMNPVGAGDLHRQFELLKAKLEAEGLFDSERKRPLPTFPRRLGIVTSPDAAGYQDVLNILRRRYPIAEIFLSSTQVQGDAAPPKIVAAIERLQKRDDIDVMLIVRGGGSLEDLWCFNDERVVRAVAASRIPTVAGVGHEIDFTLVDFAADLRAPTPSAAAELSTPDVQDVIYTVNYRDEQLNNLMTTYLGEYSDALRNRAQLLNLLNPIKEIGNVRQRLDDDVARLNAATRTNLKDQRQALAVLANRLELADPRNLLARGYAMLKTTDGERITSVQDVAQGQAFDIQVQDGTIRATVDSVDAVIDMVEED